MTYSQFIKMSLRMVIEYYNRYVAVESRTIVSEEDIYIEHSSNQIAKFVVIMCVMGEEDSKYVVQYDKKTKKIDSYLTKKIEELVK